jgi:hypothetical protein
MSLGSYHLHPPMQPSTSAFSSDSQSIKLMALMALIAAYPPISLLGSSIVFGQLPAQRGCYRALGDLALNFAPVMPRLRGRPRRGAGWYADCLQKETTPRFQSCSDFSQAATTTGYYGSRLTSRHNCGRRLEH